MKARNSTATQSSLRKGSLQVIEPPVVTVNRYQRYRENVSRGEKRAGFASLMEMAPRLNRLLLPSTVLPTGAKRPRSSYQLNMSKVRQSTKKARNIVSGSQMKIKSYVDVLNEKTQRMQGATKQDDQTYLG